MTKRQNIKWKQGQIRKFKFNLRLDNTQVHCYLQWKVHMRRHSELKIHAPDTFRRSDWSQGLPCKSQPVRQVYSNHQLIHSRTHSQTYQFDRFKFNKTNWPISQRNSSGFFSAESNRRSHFFTHERCFTNCAEKYYDPSDIIVERGPHDEWTASPFASEILQMTLSAAAAVTSRN